MAEKLAHILVVDDDERLCRMLARYLEREGYRVSTAGSGAAMRACLDTAVPDLVVLDLMLPDVDGLALARELRSRTDLGIVMLTGRVDTLERVVGLEVGADDYVCKPFDQRELLARIRSVLRRVRAPGDGATDTGPAPADGNRVRFGGFELDLAAFELRAEGGEPIALTAMEFAALALLATHPRRVFTRQQILDHVARAEHVPGDRRVDVLIGKLRRKIEADPAHPRLIRTVRNVGYRFVPP